MVVVSIKTHQEREKTNNKINDDLLSLNNEVIVSQKQYKKNESNKKTLEDKYNSLVNAIDSFKDNVKLIENDIQQKNLLSDKLKSEYDKRAILFNIHLKSVYEIILPRDALFAMKGRLPSFGDGDLIISKPYCMSSFPYPYGMGKKRNELTEGLEKFVVEYMEVFEVTNHPLLNNK